MKGKNFYLQFGVVAAYTHSHIPAGIPVSASDHSPPSIAYSLLSISYSQSGVLKIPFFASLDTCIARNNQLSAYLEAEFIP